MSFEFSEHLGLINQTDDISQKRAAVVAAIAIAEVTRVVAESLST